MGAHTQRTFIDHTFMVCLLYTLQIGTKKKDESNGSNNTKASSKSSQQPQAHVKPVERPLSDAAMKKAAQSTVPPPSKQEQDQMNEVLFRCLLAYSPHVISPFHNIHKSAF